MRFLAGVVVGIAIGRPVQKLVSEHMTPPVRRRIVKTVSSLADRLNEYLEAEDER